MRMLNLGVLAHVDAGKTTLTERLLYTAGVLDEPGSVDAGSTQTDSLALERQRGITIKSAVVSFEIDDVRVNLIDTPGHPDFIAEVERVLGVLDGAVLVVSAVEGVQPQTRILMRALQRLCVPTVVFVNKIDRRGARGGQLLTELTDRLGVAVVAMGDARSLGSVEAAFAPHEDELSRPHLLDILTRYDDSLLAAYVQDETGVSMQRLRAELARQTKLAVVHPVYFGSAATGAGVAALTTGIAALLPATTCDVDAPLSGTVFKIERGAAGEKVAYVRIFAGAVRTRDRLLLGAAGDERVTDVRVFERGSATRRSSLRAGEIGQLWGLRSVRVGDAVGAPDTRQRHRFAPPTLETVVEPHARADRGAMHVALRELADQDPLINLRHNDATQQTSVSLFGEVQKEVIAATLADDYGIAVTFRETTTICIERPVGSGSAVEVIGAADNPFLATVGLRVEPADVGAGVRFAREVELGSMPYAFMAAVEETVRRTLDQGRYGWQVIDATVTMTHSGYYARQSSAHGGFDKSMSSTAGDFRNLTPLVLMAALCHAGTRVYEPVHRFDLDLPADSVGVVLPALARLGAIPQPPEPSGRSYVISGGIAAARVHELSQLLPTLTNGAGVLESALDHYRAVAGAPPRRDRSDDNPLNRKEYLLRVMRRSGTPARVEAAGG